MEIRLLHSTQLKPLIPQFVSLLQDVVDNGASVGFLPPLFKAEATEYWQDVYESIQGQSKLLWGAFEAGELVGTIQLNLEPRANGIHRAEIAKVMVPTSQRRKGIAKAMMEAAEAEALRLGRTTLVLDTLEGHAAVLLYQSLGWQTAGVIPKYAIYQDGQQHGTVLMYKLL